MTTHRAIIAITSVCLTASGCMTAAQHQEAVRAPDEEALTVAAAQGGLREGMSGAEVLELLGSPNIVSTDADRNEVWVYDRVSTESAHSESSAGLLAILGAATGAVAGGAAPTVEQRSGATRRTQRTLTVVVRFDSDRRVRDFSYHASRF